MEQVSYYATAISFAIVIICWFVFAGTFLFRKKPEAGREAKRAPKSILGIVLQGIGFGLIWALQRTPFLSPFIGELYVLNIILQIVAVLLAVGAVWTANSAIKELGKQWSLQARLVEDHKLVTGGVYRIVRHPIYTAMLAKLLATGLILSHWTVVIIAFVIFFIGTKIRTIAEEKLLRDAFPGEYEEYAKRVPGFVPFLKI